MSDNPFPNPWNEIDRLREVNAALQEALELFLKQWNACGPNSDFGRYFSNVRVAVEAALAKGEKT